MVRPPVAYSVPRCAHFGLCGGCALQELTLEAQREAKTQLAITLIAELYGELDDVTVHSCRGTPDAYGYRNKIEMSFGDRRWLSDAEQAEGVDPRGLFMGFHAPGRFDRIADVQTCHLVSNAMGHIVTALRERLNESEPPLPWNAKEHTGFLRHAMFREGDDGCTLTLFTHKPTDADEAWVEDTATRLLPMLKGMEWRINDRVADVAQGELRRSWGTPRLQLTVLGTVFDLATDAFFQTSTKGTEVLYQTIDEATPKGQTLFDLYCGVGSIGLCLASRFERVFGIEENPVSIDNARANAKRNGIDATFVAAKVEDVLDDWPYRETTQVIVDPPRAGLHPKVARRLAKAPIDHLTYVACNPASLGRDAAILRENGWRIRELWPVDLFPQTGHIEIIGRLART